MTGDCIISAVYDLSVKYRLVEEHGHTCFTEQEDGNYIRNGDLPRKRMLWSGSCVLEIR